jgi:hypothetical protein
MTVRTRFAFVIFCFIPLLASAANDAAYAAKRFYPNFQWKTGSIQNADFSCDGRADLAILGLNGGKAVVAIFIDGVRERPALLEFANYETDLVELKSEKLTDNATDFKKMLGETPEGYRRSRICRGLNIGDGERDSAHIYWNHKKKGFSVWSL